MQGKVPQTTETEIVVEEPMIEYPSQLIKDARRNPDQASDDLKKEEDKTMSKTVPKKARKGR